jgi:Spy/CpxP family protein refolding chaperone
MLVFAALLVLGSTNVNAQQRDANAGQNGPTTQPGGNRGGREAFQQAQLKRLKDLMGSTDEEWKILEPRLQKVQDLLRDSGSRSALGSARGRRGGFGGVVSPDTPMTPVQEAAKELQDSLGSKDASPDEVKAKLTALRDARNKLQSDLQRAQDQVRELLTARQEAVLVMAGMLN